MAVTPRKLADLLALFDVLKIENNTGTVTREEAQSILIELGRSGSAEVVEELFASHPGTVHLSWIDFVKSVGRIYDLSELQMIASARQFFERYDKDKDGKLDMEEITALVKSLLPLAKQEKIKSIVDLFFPSTQETKASSTAASAKPQQQVTWRAFINQKEAMATLLKIMGHNNLAKKHGMSEDEDGEVEEDEEETVQPSSEVRPDDIHTALTVRKNRKSFKLNLDSMIKEQQKEAVEASSLIANLGSQRSSRTSTPSIAMLATKVSTPRSARASAPLAIPPKKPNDHLAPSGSSSPRLSTSPRIMPLAASVTHTSESPTKTAAAVLSPSISVASMNPQELEAFRKEMDKTQRELQAYAKELEHRELDLLKRERSLKFVMDSLKRKEEKLNAMHLELETRQSKIYDREEELAKLFGTLPAPAKETKAENRKSISLGNQFSNALKFFKQLDIRKK